MRNAFAAELTDLARKDERVVLLSGDIGNKLFDDYKAACPERFFNCGVAEANMIGIAGGMAMSGLRPVAYTIAAFCTARCYEQIRIDACYHNVPVIVVGVGAGLSYASLGATHHSCEDIGMLRLLPNMTVVCPGDPVEVRLALLASLQWPGPVYLRLGKKGEKIVHKDPSALRFEIGKALAVRDGRDVCLVSVGTMLPEVMRCADLLNEKGLSAQVMSMHTVKPLDESFLRDAFARFRAVVTIEEHSVVGGGRGCRGRMAFRQSL